MSVELEGFAVYPNKVVRTNAWMTFLRTHQREVDVTLRPEHILVERIFSSSVGGRFYLCWYPEQTAASPDVTESLNPIDQAHVTFWRECVDEKVPRLRFGLENSFHA
ncbi:DUF6176 family protein [Lacticaseibacillus paracasei]|uniref:DUF6176 family protein n=1 Tax=Lacticaseibacillus paracasei TaxID=1597 RepID=UPI000A38B596|nr:DUF6176 family protein [Lacticaseibacillus paracasei]